MKANIFEIKCPIHRPDDIHRKLLAWSADYRGIDEQIDTYFHVREGRLKLRQGNIENTLIRYHRPEVKSIKQSDVLFQPLEANQAEGLRKILSDTYGIWKIVKKQRRIYFMDNVKFHIDYVAGLGDFLEIEAIDTNGDRSSEVLKDQCGNFIRLLELDPKTFIDQSYSDMAEQE